MHLAGLLTLAAGLPVAAAAADLPFDCHLEALDEWTAPKKKWCCDRPRPNGWLPPACPVPTQQAPLRAQLDGGRVGWPAAAGSSQPDGSAQPPRTPMQPHDGNAQPRPDGRGMRGGQAPPARAAVQTPDGSAQPPSVMPSVFQPALPVDDASQVAEEDARHAIGGPEPFSADGGDPWWVTVALVLALLLSAALLMWLAVLIRKECLMGRSAVTLPHEVSAWHPWTPFSDDTKRMVVF